MIEAYKIGITIALTNHVSSALSMLSRDFAKTEAQAARLRQTLKEIRLLGVAGLAFGGIGFGMLHMLKEPLKAASEYENMLARFRSLNLGDAVNNDADKFARSSKIIGVSATEMIGTIRDLHTVMGNYAHAKELAPYIAEMQFANKAVYGEKGARFTDEERKRMARVIEIRGGWKGTDEMKLQADMMQHVMSGTGGMVLPSEYMSFLKTGGVPAQLMGNKAFYYKFEPLIQELGGFRVGTGIQTAYNRLILGVGGGGPSGKQAFKLLENIGVMNGSKILRNPVTGQMEVQHGALKDTEGYKEDPIKWTLTKLVPALKAAGYDTDSKILDAMALIFGRTGGAVFSKAYLQRDKIDKNVTVDEGAKGVAQLIQEARKTPAGAWEALARAWENFNIAVGRSLVPMVIPALYKMAGWLNDFGAWAAVHPQRIKVLVDAFLGLGAALAFSGVVLTLTAAFKALRVVLGIGGLMSALGSAAGGIGLIATLGGIAAAFTGLAIAAGILYAALPHTDKKDGTIGGPLDGLRDHSLLPKNMKMGSGHTGTPTEWLLFGDAPKYTPPSWAIPTEKPKPLGFAHDENPNDYTLKALADRIVEGLKGVVGTVELDGQKVGKLVMDSTIRRMSRAPGDSASAGPEMGLPQGW